MPGVAHIAAPSANSRFLVGGVLTRNRLSRAALPNIPHTEQIMDLPSFSCPLITLRHISSRALGPEGGMRDSNGQKLASVLVT